MWCYICADDLPDENFYRDRSRKSGFANCCKECDKKRHRKGYVHVKVKQKKDRPVHCSGCHTLDGVMRVSRRRSYCTLCYIKKCAGKHKRMIENNRRKQIERQKIALQLVIRETGSQPSYDFDGGYDEQEVIDKICGIYIRTEGREEADD